MLQPAVATWEYLLWLSIPRQYIVHLLKERFATSVPVPQKLHNLYYTI